MDDQYTKTGYLGNNLLPVALFQAAVVCGPRQHRTRGIDIYKAFLDTINVWFTVYLAPT